MALQEDFDLEQLREREQAIRQLEADIVDVNIIFKDLASMVHEQGEVVNSIEDHVDDASARVQEGTNHLQQAETYRVSRHRERPLRLSFRF